MENISAREKNCKFCNLIKTKSHELVYEDDLIAIFPDIKPKAKVHLQVVPKRHIKNVNSLKKTDLDLLLYMKEKSAEFVRNKYLGEVNLEIK
jgi:diadenosine tetraphosphate (Ap4A) HIT family hydrolase